MSDGTRRWVTLLAIVALAVGLRVAMAAVHPMEQPDSHDYNILGKQLSVAGAYVVDGKYCVRMPGYPAFLGLLLAVTGRSMDAALILQAAVSGLMVLSVYWLERRICTGVGLLAALLVAIDPLSVAFSAAVLSETTFTMLMLLGLVIVLRLVEGGRFWWWLLLGLVWAAAVYVRASALYMVMPLTVVAAWWGLAGKFRRIAGPVAACGIVLLALAPWQLAHIAQFRAGFFALTSLEGISLYEAVYPDADGSPKQNLLQPTRAMQNMNEMERNDEWSREAWRFIRQDPGRIAWLGVRKIARTWNPLFNTSELQSWPIQAVSAAWHIPLFLLAVAGIFGRSISGRIKTVLLIPVVYFTLVHALYLGSVRYRVPLMPLVCIFAAAGLIMLLQKLQSKRGASATV